MGGMISVVGVQQLPVSVNDVAGSTKSPEGDLNGRKVGLNSPHPAAKKLFQSLINQAKGVVKVFSQIKQVLSEKGAALFNWTQSAESKASKMSIGAPVLQAKNGSPEVLKQKAEYAKGQEKDFPDTAKNFSKAIGQLNIDSRDALASGNGAFRKMTTALTAPKDSENVQIKELAKEILATPVGGVVFQQWGDKGALLKAAVIETKQLPDMLSSEQKQGIVEKAQADLQNVSAKAELLEKAIQEGEELDYLRGKFNEELAKLDEQVEALDKLDRELKLQELESQYEPIVTEDASTGKKINLDQATSFYGRSVKDDKTKALFDAVSALSTEVKKKDKFTLSPQQQQNLVGMFIKDSLTYVDIKKQVKTTADLKWLRDIAPGLAEFERKEVNSSNPAHVVGFEVAGSPTNLTTLTTALKSFVANTDKQWAEKNKENPEDQLDAVKRNQFMVDQLEQQASQWPQTINELAYQKLTGPDGAQWRGVFDFATEKLSYSDELMETEEGKVLISLPTKLTTTLEKLAEVTAKQLGKEAPIALSESNWIDSFSSLSKAELAALEGIGIKKSYLDD